MVTKRGEDVLARIGRVVKRGIVADEDHLDSLEAENAVGLGPAAVVADRHPHDPVESAPHGKAVGAGLEVAPFEVLEPSPGLVLFVSRKMNLAILPDDPAVALDENLGVVVVPVGGELGVAETKTHTELLRLVEEKPRRRPRHLALEERVDLTRVLHVPAGEERRERELGEDDEIASAFLRAREQREHPLYDLRPCFAPSHGTELGGADRHQASHDAAGNGSVSVNVRTVWRSTFAPSSRSAGSVCSRGLWLRPFTLGVKIIPEGQTRASIWASCPAPAGSLRTLAPRDDAVCSTREIILGSKSTGSKRARRRVEISTPSASAISPRNSSNRASAD